MRDRFLGRFGEVDAVEVKLPKPAQAEKMTASPVKLAPSTSSPRPVPVAKMATATPQKKLAKKPDQPMSVSESTPTKAQSPEPHDTTPKAARAVSTSTPTKAQVPMVSTPNIAVPVVDSPLPATKIFAAESAKFKTRRTRNKKAKVPASPSPTKETKEQTAPSLPSSEFDFRATPTKQALVMFDTLAIETPKVAMPVAESPSPATKTFAAEAAKSKTRTRRNKKTKVPASSSPMKLPKEEASLALPSADLKIRHEDLLKLDAIVPMLTSLHVRNVSDSSSASSHIVARRLRGDSSSSSDEDKPSTGKTTPHRLSEASESDKPLDLFKEYAPEPDVEADFTVSGDSASIADETTTESVAEHFAKVPAEDSLLAPVTAEISIDDEIVSGSLEDALLAAVANDTVPLFLERTGRPSKMYEYLLPTPMSTFGKTTLMVKQIVDSSATEYLAEDDEAHNIELVNILDVYHCSGLPKMVMSTEQVKEQAAFDLAMSKHRNDLIRHAAQEVTPPKVPQTKADAQMSALFAIELQSVEKNGTIFFNPSYKSLQPVICTDVEEDPAIVSLVASLPSGTGLVASLTRLGPNRPLASWSKSTLPMTMVEAPGCGLEAAISHLRAREAVKFVAAQSIVPALVVEPFTDAVSSMKDSPMRGYFTDEFSTVNAEEPVIEVPVVEDPILDAPAIEEPVANAAEAPVLTVPAPAVATPRHPQKHQSPPRPSRS